MDSPRIKIGRNEAPVYLKVRYTGTLLMGKSGGGKSKLIENMYFQDEIYGQSKVLIDPSGELSRTAYSISKGKARYCSLQTPISINPMHSPYPPDTISELIAEVINQVVLITTPNEKFTVKMRGILDEEIKYCLSNNRKSLIHVRDRIVNRKGDGETRDGIIQRLNFVLSDERIEKIICGSEAVKWGELIQNQESFIMDCSGMGREKMIFAGNLISQGIKNYFRFERPKEYKPLNLYIDECHNFVNQNFFDILKEGRRYKIACLLSTQDFAAIRDEALVRVMLNSGNLISFRVGYREAQMIGKEMGKIKEDEIEYGYDGRTKPIKFDTTELLQNLEKYHFAYMTPDGKGIAKAPSPLFIRKLEPTAEPQKKSEGMKWFLLESYQSEAPQ